MDADDQTILATVNQIRLEENRSYAGLAAEIGLHPSGLHRILTGRRPDPWDRTMIKLRRFLAQREAAAARRTRRRA